MQQPCDVMNSRTTHDDVGGCFVCVECVSTVVVARAVVVLLLVLYSSRRD
jgi:hypothetical protein